MASNQRLLKAYARYDGSGRVVPSSTIFRKNMPKVGKWKEVQEYLCCNGLELFNTPSLPIINLQLGIECNGSLIHSEFIFGEWFTLNELVAAMNADPLTSAIGYFVAQSDGSIKLTVPDAVKQEYCPTGTMSFQAVSS
jgi:hypothetical protein